MKTDFSGHSIINGLLSSKPENIFETIQILTHIDVNGIPSNILNYLRVSPLCIELLQAWSKYVIESISVKKSKSHIQNGESIERKIVCGALNCISEIFEYYIRMLRININQLDEFKDNIEKLGVLIISKYKMNIYRHLNSTSKILISSALRLLASVSSLSKVHKQEILHEFNFTLPSFLSISKFFEYKKRERSELEQISILQDDSQDIFTLLFEKRSEIGVRVQYLRFVFSFLDISFVESSKLHDSRVAEKDIVQFLKIRNISNSIFKNSIHYDTFNISKGLLFVFEDTILENEEISNAIKASFFNLTVINYIFNNLVEILSQVDLKNQLENRNAGLERYARIIEKLLRLHTNTKTKEKIRLIFLWFKSINKQVKYPIIQQLLVNIYCDLTFQEKMDYFESSTVQINYFGESKLEGILVSGFVSSLIKIISPVEKDELQRFIIQNIISKNSVPELGLELDLKYLVNWIIPPFIRKTFLGAIGPASASGPGMKLLTTAENLFVNISNLVIFIHLSRRLSFIIDLIISKSPESQLNDRIEYIINTIKQIIYHSFPETGHILNLLRYYFKQASPQESQQNVIDHFFLKRDHYNTSSRSSFLSESCIGNKEDEDDDDDIFINIITSKSPDGKEKKSKVVRQKPYHADQESSVFDHELLEKENISSNMAIFHFIKAQINSHHNNMQDNLVMCK
ncbi:Nucleolar pre-ribosomal-associated protein 1 C-terminal domain containing protein, partial [Cryptosporidium meleagridis]